MEPCPPLAIWAPTRWAAPDSSKMSSIVHHQDEALVVVGPRADAVGFEKLVKAGLKCLGVHLEAGRLGERREKGRMRHAAGHVEREAFDAVGEADDEIRPADDAAHLEGARAVRGG